MFKKIRNFAAAVIIAVLTLSMTVPSFAAGNNTTAAASMKGITLENKILPSGTLQKGSAFTVSGKIVSEYKLIKVIFTVKNASGKTVMTASANPNSKSFSLYSLDSKLGFSKLAAGKYTWNLTTCSLFHAKEWKGSFTVKTSDLKGSGVTYPSGTLVKGRTFSCKGTVSSASGITKVTMSVYSTDGVKQFEASASPKTKTYDLHKLDAKMTFRKLAAGRYVYRVTVTNGNGVTRNVITTSFTVK